MFPLRRHERGLDRLMPAGRRPAEGVRLEFVRKTSTRTVHIVCGGEARNWLPTTRYTHMNADATAMLNVISDPCQMLCGAKLLVGSSDEFPGCWEAGSAFADGDLCVRCVQALGPDSWRAFHSDNRAEWA